MSEFSKEENDSTESVPKEFHKIVKDFVRDILTTFPEYIPKLDDDLKEIGMKEKCSDALDTVYKYCKTVVPERFFDILYQNEDIFSDMEMNTDFLPGIDFKYLWSCDISSKTKETIWKYLQLLLFTMVGSFDNSESFGDTAKMFESIDQEEFKTKLEDTIGQMHNLFNSNNDKEDNSSSGINMDNIPNPDELHSHITGMLDGNLGKLAREIAEETAGDLNLDLNEDANMDDVFKKMMGDPTKLMGLVKNVGSKLDNRIKSGELKETELLAEAGEMMKKMKNMPGMENIQSMLSQMGGLGGMGRNKSRKQKVDMNAFNNMMEKQTKQSEMRERMMKQTEKKLQMEAEKKAKEAAIPKRTEAESEKAMQELLAMDDNEKLNSKKPKKKKKKKT
jgi:hypothetical protein